MTEPSWDRLDSWWREEAERDPEYRSEIWPLVIELLEPEPDHRYLDLGCGSGAVMAALVERGSRVVGTDISLLLLREAAAHGPVVQGRLPDLGWVAPASLDGACLSVVLKHIEDEAGLFAQAAATVRADGVLAAVLNHPVWTAPGSSPMLDDDGEVLWRPGRYFSGASPTNSPGGNRSGSTIAPWRTCSTRPQTPAGCWSGWRGAVPLRARRTTTRSSPNSGTSPGCSVSDGGGAEHATQRWQLPPRYSPAQGWQRRPRYSSAQGWQLPPRYSPTHGWQPLDSGMQCVRVCTSRCIVV